MRKFVKVALNHRLSFVLCRILGGYFHWWRCDTEMKQWNPRCLSHVVFFGSIFFSSGMLKYCILLPISFLWGSLASAAGLVGSDGTWLTYLKLTSQNHKIVLLIYLPRGPPFFQTSCMGPEECKKFVTFHLEPQISNIFFRAEIKKWVLSRRWRAGSCRTVGGCANGRESTAVSV